MSFGGNHHRGTRAKVDRSVRRRAAHVRAERFEALRARDVAAREEPLVIASVKGRIPAGIWFGAFSRTHPGLELELVSVAEASPRTSVSDMWVRGGAGGSWKEAMARFPDVRSVDCLVEIGGGYIYRVTFDSPPIVHLFRELGQPFQFPLRIRAGFLYLEVVARLSTFRKILAFLRSRDPEIVILALRRRGLRNHLPELSDTQRSLLARAMAEGYFAVPRSITLTDLARKLGRSKSSVSEALALIEKRVLESALRPAAAFA